MSRISHLLSRLALVGIIVLISYISFWFIHGDLLDPQGLLLIPNTEQASVYVNGSIVGRGSVCLPWIPQGHHTILFHTGTEAPDMEQGFSLEVHDTNLISLENAYQTDAMTVMNRTGTVYLHHCQSLTR